MDYRIYTLTSPDRLERCPLFHINNFQWTCRQRPEAYGRMGYLPGQGLLVHMVCREADPKRKCKKDREMVCEDSAVEAFFALPEHSPAAGKDEPPDDDGLYLNMEINANGALYAKYGRGRKNRKFISNEACHAAQVKANILPDSWSVRFLVPRMLLRSVWGVEELAPGDAVYCNFYKISQDPQIEHYASFHPVDSDIPNFHLPSSFARAVIQA